MSNWIAEDVKQSRVEQESEIKAELGENYNTAEPAPQVICSHFSMVEKPLLTTFVRQCSECGKTSEEIRNERNKYYIIEDSNMDGGTDNIPGLIPWLRD